MEKSYRARLIGMIHMQSNAAALTDEEYRSVIIGATGKDSCTHCEISELFAIHRDLNTVLVKQGRKPYVFHARKNRKMTIKDAVVAKANKVLGDDWSARLDGFMKRFNKSNLDACTDNEVRQIMAWLSTVERNKKNGN